MTTYTQPSSRGSRFAETRKTGPAFRLGHTHGVSSQNRRPDCRLCELESGRVSLDSTARRMPVGRPVYGKRTGDFCSSVRSDLFCERVLALRCYRSLLTELHESLLVRFLQTGCPAGTKAAAANVYLMVYPKLRV